MSQDAGLESELSVQAMREARTAPSVFKTRLLATRAQFPVGVIVVLEGDHDVGVYDQWIRRVRPELSYEAITCNGKRNVLSLKKAVDRDVNGLRNGVYYFVDRDFDDLQGGAADDTIFMTDRYSIENYLATEKVLDDLLKITFHLHGLVDLRNTICAHYRQALDRFARATSEVNRLIHACRVSGIALERVPKSTAKLLTVTLDGAEVGESTPEDFLRPPRVPTDEEWKVASVAFDKLDPLTRYRGKFFVGYFIRWLELLASQHKARAGYFGEFVGDGAVNNAAFNIENFATKAEEPEGFVEFVRRVKFVN